MESPEPDVAYDPNRVTRRLASLALIVQLLWPMALIGVLFEQTAAAVVMLAGAGALTFRLYQDLRRRAVAKGYGAAWGSFALLGWVGLVVIFALPDHEKDGPPRGFPVAPTDRADERTE